MATATVDIGTLITCTADVRGGRPRIVGTGVTVQRVVGWYKLGLEPEEIAEELGHLTLAQVYAALAYYHVNRDEIESAIAADEAEADKLDQRHSHKVPRIPGAALVAAQKGDGRDAVQSATSDS